MGKETVLITGASSGIGEEFARLFASAGSDLILVARSKDKLETLAAELRTKQAVQVRVLAKDLSKHEAPQEIFDELTREGVVVDVLVNNAGFGQVGRFRKIPLERHLDMLQVNVVSLTHLSRLFLPGMIERNRGAILNVASTAGFQPGPNGAVYFASKGYVISLSRALESELLGTKVTVTCLCPGPTKTSFGGDSGMGETPLFRHNTMELAPVVKAGYKGMRKGRGVVIPGFINKFMVFINRLALPSAQQYVVTQLQPFKDEP